MFGAGPNGFNGAAARRPRYVWSGEMSMCPKVMVPLQIDLATDVGRYRFDLAVNPTCRACYAPARRIASSISYRTTPGVPVEDVACV
jgi:hypothetical protein